MSKVIAFYFNVLVSSFASVLVSPFVPSVARRAQSRDIGRARDVNSQHPFRRRQGYGGQAILARACPTKLQRSRDERKKVFVLLRDEQRILQSERKILVLLSLLAVAVTLSAASDQEYWLQAQARYQQQDFAGAATALQTVAHKTAPVWYNLANCADQLQDDLTALALWRRAQTLELRTLGYTGPIYRAAAQQIVRAQARLATSNYRFDATRAQMFGLSAFAVPAADQRSLANANPAGQLVPAAAPTGSRHNGSAATVTAPAATTGSVSATAIDNLITTISALSQRWLHAVLTYWQLIWQPTPLLFWQLLFLLSWLSCGYLFYRTCYQGWQFVEWAQLRQKMSFRKQCFALLLLLSCALFGYTLYTKWQFNQTEWGLVTAKVAALYLGPGLDYPRLATTLPAATFVKILAEKPQSWYAVQMADHSVTGWLTASDVVRC